MKNLTLISRLLFAIPFILFGINHFIMADFYMGILTSFVPLGYYSIILTGLVLILAGVAIISGRFIQTATMGLSVLLGIFIVTIHIPHLLNPEQYQTQTAEVLITLLKDISLAGASLFIYSIYRQPEASPKNP